MKSITLYHPEKELEYKLQKQPSGNGVTRWQDADNQLCFSLRENEIVELVNKTPLKKIWLEHAFLNKLLEYEELQREAEASGTEVEEKEEEKPNFDPDHIRVEDDKFRVFHVIELIERQELDISPDFQRNFVWDRRKQSRLIESLLLRIPLPVFYLAQDSEGILHVVDGLQRLTTIYNFVKGKLALRDLEYLELDGQKFENLSLKFKRRVEQYSLACYLIDPSTPAPVKFEIFKRINQGGKKLNAQEIRNSMAKPSVREFLYRLASSTSFTQATDGSVRPLRMDDQDLVLRFIAFYLEREGLHTHDYAGSMDIFLDATLELLNRRHQDSSFFIMLEERFTTAMENAFFLFGTYAFRKCLPEHLEDGAKRQLINKSLFTTWSVVLASLRTKSLTKNYEKGILSMPLAHFLKQEEDAFTEFFEADEKIFSYFDSITTGTNQRNKIRFGFRVAQDILSKHTHLAL